MKRIFILLLSVFMVHFAPVSAQNVPSKGKVFLDCHALTTSYSYTQLYGDVAGCLTDAGFILARSADDANWTIQVNGSTGKMKETTYGSTTWYFTEVIATIMIDRGAYASRVFETNITLKGSYNTDYDDAALDAYRRLTPQICETILRQISH